MTVVDPTPVALTRLADGTSIIIISTIRETAVPRVEHGADLDQLYSDWMNAIANRYKCHGLIDLKRAHDEYLRAVEAYVWGRA